jgi:hypothetical protein
MAIGRECQGHSTKLFFMLLSIVFPDSVSPTARLTSVLPAESYQHRSTFMLDIFALVVLLLLVGVGIWLVVLLGNLPGNIAREAGHPQAEAITVLSCPGWAC